MLDWLFTVFFNILLSIAIALFALYMGVLILIDILGITWELPLGSGFLFTDIVVFVLSIQLTVSRLGDYPFFSWQARKWYQIVSHEITDRAVSLIFIATILADEIDKGLIKYAMLSAAVFALLVVDIGIKIWRMQFPKEPLISQETSPEEIQ
ncbi:MAG: hypothetical protein SW833_13575 [Cyanobacteriota bacterium]|nr:hypothetical protein [Cyanobacteriota bacterium]